MFKKILVANRGEIACRVMRTAREMEIATVAVYSDADANALHVTQADEAINIGPAPSSESYLAIDKIVGACQRSGAEAVHPGYGFLAENPKFVDALAEAGIVFIGPPRAAIAAMGDKIESKALAQNAGVNTIPGHAGVVKDAKEAARIAEEIGYPVMLKASAGGGGKGMRIARTPDEVKDGFRGATNEAKSSFGDDRVFIEKFIEEPRHIEIQVLADGHGKIVHLGERECSVQRRHQKVVEEAPSPFLDAKTRAAMGKQAVLLAKEVGYVSAGTVEFMVDKDRNFYFLEMNTRLQVEHPVTELVTGIDLVEAMIRIAAGERLELTQKDVSLDGWALEARIYAEDPSRDFLPSIGRLTRLRAPEGVPGIRVDAGVTEGSEISLYYDPMIAKLISSGATRDEAIARMRSALDSFYVRGIDHNIDFLGALMAHPRFVAGEINTDFIADAFPNGYGGRPTDEEGDYLLLAIAGLVHQRLAERDANVNGRAGAVRFHPPRRWNAQSNGRGYALEVSDGVDGVVQVRVDGRMFRVACDWRPGDVLCVAQVNGSDVRVQVDRLGVSYRLRHGGTVADVLVLGHAAAELAALMPDKAQADTSKMLLSPMPGLLVSVAVQPGQQVKQGEELAVVEAMKMENVLRADRDCVVAALRAEPGDGLAVDQVILEFE